MKVPGNPNRATVGISPIEHHALTLIPSEPDLAYD